MNQKTIIISLCVGIMFCSVFNFSIAASHNTPTGHKDILNKPLSEKEHEGDDGEHNKDFDHDAFLGKDKAEEFDNLTPEQSKQRLGDMVDKIDTDKDGFVSEAELRAWIKLTSQRYLKENRDRQWKDFFGDDKDAKTLTWATYKTKNFGAENSSTDDLANKAIQRSIKRDEDRWAAADADKDGAMNKEEFLAFLHPEEFPSMHEVVVSETLGDMDKNKDGKISLEEYIEDLWTPEEGNTEEPSWVTTEREQFSTTRDFNKDGFMDRDEIRKWIVPSDYNHIDSETKHLIEKSDDDKDGKLTKEEILKHYDIFVGSQATDYGEYLNKKEEL